MHITIEELLDYLKKDFSYREQLLDSHDVLYIYESEEKVHSNIDRTISGRGYAIDFTIVDDGEEELHGVEFI